MAEKTSIAGSKASLEKLEKAPSSTGERKPSEKDETQNPCTACTLIRCKANSPVSTCAPCTFLPDKYNLSSTMRRSSCYPPSPLCAPRCPPSPLCGPRCPPSPLCPPRCPPPCCPPSPKFTLPPRCFRCCEVTGSSPILPKKSYCSPPICPPPKCDPCLLLKYDPCRPRCDPCLPKYDPCPPKYDPCPPKCDPCLPPCPPPCPPPEKEEKAPTPPPPPPEPVPEPAPEPVPEPAPEPVRESVEVVKPDPCPNSPPPVHRCPSDVEAERPKYFIESITGDYTWQAYGVRIQFTDPISPGASTVKLGNPLTVRLGIEVKANTCLSGDIITAYMWTPMKTNCNPCGTWKDLPLHYQPDQTSTGECGVKRYVYSSTLTPTESDTFRLTFNIKWGSFMIWANNYGDDNMVGVGDRASFPN